MAKQRRKISLEFKAEAVRRIAREFELGENLLRSWKQTLVADGDQAFPGKGHASGYNSHRAPQHRPR